ncbi:MAG TPA: class I SAM-dependent methyltransferase [Acidimicrobiales bacterium]|nr:class I SAM-dependent methyltransferase [Acidimicrobiales bacterium]
MPGLTPHWTEADAHAALGLPVTTGRMRALRRLVGRLLWPFLRHQVVVNRALLAELDAVRSRLDADERQLVRAFGDLEHHSSVLVRHEEPLDRHEFLLKHLEPAIDDIVRQFELVQDKIDLGQRQAFARYHEGIGPLRAELGEIARRLDEIAAEAGRASRRATEAVTRATDAAARAAEPGATAPEARAGVSEGWRRALDDVWLRMGQLDLFLAEARRAFPAPAPPEALAALPSGFDSLKLVFEEAFRGPVPVVTERVRAYVDDLARCGGPVLDLGCGRGELLDVLAEASVEAYGVDVNAEHVARGRERGLDVRHEDARAHLAGLEERSLGAVTAIQLVEHLAIDELVEIVELAARAVRPGGLIVLETPNPENVVVGSSSFYLDPTHTRPLPPALLAFVVAARGFGEVEVRRLERGEQPPGLARPKPGEPWAEALGPLVDAVNFHLFGPADYAVIGRRP